MAKILLLSVLIATVAVPIAFARARTTRMGLRRVVWGMAIFLFLWVCFCFFLFLRMGGGY